MCPECGHSWYFHCTICGVCHAPTYNDRAHRTEACGCLERVPKRKRNTSTWNLGRAPIDPPIRRQRTA